MTVAVPSGGPALLERGEPARNLILPDVTGRSLNLYGRSTAGRPVVLVFLAEPRSGAGRALLGVLAERAELLQGRDATVVAVTRCKPAVNIALAREIGWPWPLLSDADGRAAEAFAAAAASAGDFPPVTYLLAPNLKVVAGWRGGDAAALPERLFALLDSDLAPQPPNLVGGQAPVLVIPDVLGPAECRRLMEMWESRGNEPSGFMRKQGDRSVMLQDPQIKIRRDHFLSDPADIGPIQAQMARRVLPELERAFQFRAGYFEDLRIACYDSSSGGYFRQHRDNSSPGTVHRRFAMSLNLNTGAYEGGYLRFPEYGNHLYRPETGAAVIFSCSLLHEATDVTAGRRFVLLSFLYGEEDEQRRRAYFQRIHASA